MKSKNVARLFIFVFFLCFVVLCQSKTTQTVQIRWDVEEIDEWVIPDSIKEDYPEDPTKKDWKDLRRDLLFKINKLDADIDHFSEKPIVLAKELAKQRVWLKRTDGTVVSGVGGLRKFLKGKKIRIHSIPKIEWFHFQTNDDVDITATVTFNYEIQSSEPGSDLQTLDPSGSGEYGHRRICTWF